MDSVIKIRKIEHSYKSNESRESLTEANTMKIETKMTKPTFINPVNDRENSPTLAKIHVRFIMILTDKSEEIKYLELNSKFEVVIRKSNQEDSVSEDIEYMERIAFEAAGARFIMDMEYVLQQFNLPIPNLPFELFSHMKYEVGGE